MLTVANDKWNPTRGGLFWFCAFFGSRRNDPRNHTKRNQVFSAVSCNFVARFTAQISSQSCNHLKEKGGATSNDVTPPHALPHNSY